MAYNNTSEYIRSLIRQDLKKQGEALTWLQNKLSLALNARDSEFIQVSAADVVKRNKGLL